jgi:hypothetical protein
MIMILVILMDDMYDNYGNMMMMMITQMIEYDSEYFLNLPIHPFIHPSGYPFPHLYIQPIHSIYLFIHHSIPS